MLYKVKTEAANAANDLKQNWRGEVSEPRTLKALAAEALQIQDTVNPVAVIGSAAESIVELKRRLEIDGLPCGTDAVRSHAIFRLWVSKLHDMAGMGISDLDRYHEASEECKRLAS